MSLGNRGKAAKADNLWLQAVLRWEAFEEVGSGGFVLGHLLTVQTNHKVTMQPYAVKVIEVGELKEHQLVLLINECRVLRIAQHKNLMDIYDIYMKDNKLFVSKTVLLCTNVG